MTFVLILLSVSFVSYAGDPLIITSSTTTEKRSISKFIGISSKGAMKVIVRLGQTESVRMEGDRTAIANITTQVNNNKLEIVTKNFKSNINYARVTVFVTTRKLETLELGGSGSVNVESPVETNKVSLMVSGSGTMKLTGHINYLSGAISGSGRIIMDGSAKNTNISINGSGSFSGDNLKTQTLSGSILGSGSITASVSSQLNTTIKGSGTVHYIGDPKVYQANTGSGRARKIT